MSATSCGGNADGPQQLSASTHEHLLGGDTEPGATRQGADGLWYTDYPSYIEVSAWEPGEDATDDQRQAGERLVTEVRAALGDLATVAAARAAGYEPHPSIDEFHLLNRAYLTDDKELDATRPEFLVIDPDAGVVLGAMFVWPRGQHGPQLAGPPSVWHYHPAATNGDDFRCWEGFLPVTGGYDPSTDTCRQGQRGDNSPEMLHVWAIDHPGGPFATPMPSRA